MAVGPGLPAQTPGVFSSAGDHAMRTSVVQGVSASRASPRFSSAAVDSASAKCVISGSATTPRRQNSLQAPTTGGGTNVHVRALQKTGGCRACSKARPQTLYVRGTSAIDRARTRNPSHRPCTYTEPQPRPSSFRFPFVFSVVAVVPGPRSLPAVTGEPQPPRGPGLQLTGGRCRVGAWGFGLSCGAGGQWKEMEGSERKGSAVISAPPCFGSACENPIQDKPKQNNPKTPEPSHPVGVLNPHRRGF